MTRMTSILIFLIFLLLTSGNSGFAQQLDLEGVLPDASTPATLPETLDSPNPVESEPPEIAPNEPVASQETHEEETESQKHSFWFILSAGGTIGWIIILLSIVAGAMAIEYLISIRLIRLVPPVGADAIFQSLQTGNRAKAIKICKEQGGFLGNVILAGLSQPGSSWAVIEKALEDAISEHAGRLYRRIDYLSLIANIAPMLGLLGTVVGMIMAFRNLALSDGFSQGANLAEGIYFALVTTVEGLVVAIPALAAHAYFTNRVSNVVSDATYTIEQIIRPVKQWALMKESGENIPLKQSSTGGTVPPGSIT